jgi:hypothetical protein
LCLGESQLGKMSANSAFETCDWVKRLDNRPILSLVAHFEANRSSELLLTIIYSEIA